MGSVHRCLTAFVVCVVFGAGTAAAAAPIHPEGDDGWEGRNEGSQQGSDCEEKDRDRPGRGPDRERDGGEDGSCDHPGRGRGQGHRDDEDEGHGRGREDAGGVAGRDRTEKSLDGTDAAVIPASTPPAETPIEPAAGSLDLTVRASRVVARVGDEIAYTVMVTNIGDTDLSDVTVIDLVPPELDVVSVPLVDGVEAAQAGRSPSGEDVVWVLEVLAPRASVELSWTGIVRHAGDLEVTNVVTATSEGSQVRASTTTFLATATGVAAQGTAPEVMPKRIVTVKRIPARAVVPGAPLPVTALAIEWLIAIALAICFVGMTLLILGRRPATVGRGWAFALVLLAAVYAATSITDPSTTFEPRPSETVKDQVKGKRIERDRARPASSPRRASPRGDRDDLGEAPQGSTEGSLEPAEPQTIRTVRVVSVPVDATTIPSGPGDNNVAFSWDESIREITQATSSRGPLTATASYELLTTLGTTNDAIEATLLLRNLSDEVIAVRGVLIHELTGEGVSTSLRSRPVDVILRPRGKVRATFRYLLPSGDYQAGARFEAD